MPNKWKNQLTADKMSRNPAKMKNRQALRKTQVQLNFYKNILAPFENASTTTKFPSTIGNSLQRHSSAKCYLLELPVELRTSIYEYVVTRTDAITLALRTSTSYGLPRLAMVSKQLHTEVVPVFYACNAFLIKSEARHIFRLSGWLKQRFAAGGAKPFRSLRLTVPDLGWATLPRLIPLIHLAKAGEVRFDKDFLALNPVRELDSVMIEAFTESFKVVKRARNDVKGDVLLRIVEGVFEQQIRKSGEKHTPKRMSAMKTGMKKAKAQMMRETSE